MSPVYLSTAYLAPVQYYNKLLSYESVVIEAYENYVKQTYRNRCMIATANGVQSLTIPVEKSAMPNHELSIVNCQLSIIKDIRIADHGNWQHNHWNALVSAYGQSPFFEYYRDDFAPFYNHKFRYLFDWNEQLRLTVCELLDIHPHVSFSTGYDVDVPNDFRESINPRHPATDHSFDPQPYYQVFREKHGFIPNLSIVDLLFNMGPEAVIVIKESSPFQHTVQDADGGD